LLQSRATKDAGNRMWDELLWRAGGLRSGECLHLACTLALVGKGRHALNSQSIDDENLARIFFLHTFVNAGGDE
jgi:hypothetical protein